MNYEIQIWNLRKLFFYKHERIPWKSNVLFILNNNTKNTNNGNRMQSSGKK